MIEAEIDNAMTLDDSTYHEEKLRHLASGIVRLNLQGSRTHHLYFDIPFSFEPRAAVVSLALSDIRNREHAVNLRYSIDQWSVSYHANFVRVSCTVTVGDTDGYVRGLSYFCVATN